MQRKHACSREMKKRDTHGQRRWRKNNLTVIYQVIVIFVYDAHLQCVRMNVGWAGAWHVLDLAGDCECDAFKLHFFLDCCFVLFVRLSNGYARIIAMMITGQANIVFFIPRPCLGNWMATKIKNALYSFSFWDDFLLLLFRSAAIYIAFAASLF